MKGIFSTLLIVILLVPKDTSSNQQITNYKLAKSYYWNLSKQAMITLNQKNEQIYFKYQESLQ